MIAIHLVRLDINDIPEDFRSRTSSYVRLDEKEERDLQCSVCESEKNDLPKAITSYLDLIKDYEGWAVLPGVKSPKYSLFDWMHPAAIYIMRSISEIKIEVI